MWLAPVPDVGGETLSFSQNCLDQSGNGSHDMIHAGFPEARHAFSMTELM